MIINYSDQEVIKGKKAIFLAGPTPRDKSVESWRPEACRILEENDFDGVVYVPEYSTDSPLEDYDVQAGNRQVMWERNALLNSSVIVFWIPREITTMPAFTTNVEFGYWLHSGKAIYGRPEDAPKNRYLDWLYTLDTGLEPYDNIEDLLIASIEKANEKGVNEENEILPLQKRKLFKKD